MVKKFSMSIFPWQCFLARVIEEQVFLDKLCLHYFDVSRVQQQQQTKSVSYVHKKWVRVNKLETKLINIPCQIFLVVNLHEQILSLTIFPSCSIFP